MMRNTSRKAQVVLNKKSKLRKAFEFAKSVDERLKIFKEMEKLFDETDLGIYCIILTSELLRNDRSPELVLSFGNRALRILISNDNTNTLCFGEYPPVVPIVVGETDTRCDCYHNSSYYIGLICNLLASACYKLNRYNEVLSYLNWADRNLCKLDAENISPCDHKCVLRALLYTQEKLRSVKEEKGRYGESFTHLRKQLECQEKIMKKGCMELGDTYEDVSYAYGDVSDFEEAVSFYLKALEIRVKHMGPNSVKVAKMRTRLAELYNELGENEKALEQNQLSRNVLKETSPSSYEWFKAEAVHGGILIGLGKYEEGISVLKAVVSHPDIGERQRGITFVSLANAFSYLEKFSDAKKLMRTAQTILEKEEVCSNDVVTGFWGMSMLYEKMNDFRKAISLVKRVLAIPDISPKILADGSERLFSLISLTGKEKKEIPYMEDVLEKMKKAFGPKHCEVAYGYKNLGAAYLKSGQEMLAVKCMVKSKDIMDATVGPHHLDSLNTSQTLAETYATLRRYDLAVDIQRKVVEGLKVLRPTEHEKLAEAVSLLRKMELATGADSEDFAVKN